MQVQVDAFDMCFNSLMESNEFESFSHFNRSSEFDDEPGCFGEKDSKHTRTSMRRLVHQPEQKPVRISSGNDSLHPQKKPECELDIDGETGFFGEIDSLHTRKNLKLQQRQEDKNTSVKRQEQWKRAFKPNYYNNQSLICGDGDEELPSSYSSYGSESDFEWESYDPAEKYIPKGLDNSITQPLPSVLNVYPTCSREARAASKFKLQHDECNPSFSCEKLFTTMSWVVEPIPDQYYIQHETPSFIPLLPGTPCDGQTIPTRTTSATVESSQSNLRQRSRSFCVTNQRSEKHRNALTSIGEEDCGLPSTPEQHRD